MNCFNSNSLRNLSLLCGSSAAKLRRAGAVNGVFIYSKSIYS